MRCTLFCNFIDDYLKKVWVFALKSKDQVFDTFKFFHAYVKRGAGRKLKYVRADNRDEHRRLVNQHCRSYTITIEKIVL